MEKTYKFASREGKAVKAVRNRMLRFNEKLKESQKPVRVADPETHLEDVAALKAQAAWISGMLSILEAMDYSIDADINDDGYYIKFDFESTRWSASYRKKELKRTEADKKQ